MAQLTNSMTRLVPNTSQVYGVILQDSAATSGGLTVSLVELSGYQESDQQQVMLARTSAGIYTLTITDFLTYGGANAAVLQLTCQTSGAGYLAAYTVSTSATSQTVTYTINTFSASTPADCSVAFVASTY